MNIKSKSWTNKLQQTVSDLRRRYEQTTVDKQADRLVEEKHKPNINSRKDQDIG